MPQPCLSHSVRLQPPCASPRLLRWPPAAVRARQRRLARLLRVGVAGLGRLAGTVAEELANSKLAQSSTCVDGALGIDLLSVLATLNEWFNVELWLSPANVR